MQSRFSNSASLSRLRAHPFFPYLLILALCLLAFGLLAPSLGFYWDDWPLVYLAEQGGGAFAEFFSYNRPQGAWPYLIAFQLLGANPLPWHLLLILLQFLSAAAFYSVLRALWPRRERQALWAALLFCVYPTFFSHSMAVAFSQHYFTYFLYFISMAAALWALRRPEQAAWLTGLALAAQALQLFTMEYFVGLELLRPLALYWLLAGLGRQNWRQTFKPFARRYAPYLLILLAYLVWRFALVEIPGDPNQLSLLAAFRAAPFTAALDFMQTVLRDGLHMLVSAWYATLQPTLLDFSSPADLAIWGLVALLALALATLLRPGAEDEAAAWPRQAALAGLLALVLGLLPVWLVGRDPLEGLYSDRFTLAALPGAALLWVALIDGALSGPRAKAAFLAILLALAVGAHLRVANDYRHEWLQQRRFFDQLALRAPALEPGTAIIMEGAISARVSDYAAAAAVNTFYPQSERPDEDYWVLQFGRKVEFRLEDLADGLDFDEQLHNLSFEGSSKQSIVLFDQSDAGACLWLLTDFDVHNAELGENLRLLAEYADTTAIQTDAPPAYPPAVFNLPLEAYWCQYFQRADLAAQQGDWDQVLAELAAAEAAGLDPNQGREYLPFIRAYAAQGDWPAAADLTQRAYEKSFAAQALLCAFWEQQAEEHTDAEGFAAAWDRLRPAVGCP